MAEGIEALTWSFTSLGTTLEHRDTRRKWNAWRIPGMTGHSRLLPSHLAGVPRYSADVSTARGIRQGQRSALVLHYFLVYAAHSASSGVVEIDRFIKLVISTTPPDAECTAYTKKQHARADRCPCWMPLWLPKFQQKSEELQSYEGLEWAMHNRPWYTPCIPLFAVVVEAT